MYRSMRFNPRDNATLPLEQRGGGGGGWRDVEPCNFTGEKGLFPFLSARKSCCVSYRREDGSSTGGRTEATFLLPPSPSMRDKDDLSRDTAQSLGWIKAGRYRSS